MRENNGNCCGELIPLHNPPIGLWFPQTGTKQLLFFLRSAEWSRFIPKTLVQSSPSASFHLDPAPKPQPPLVCKVPALLCLWEDQKTVSRTLNRRSSVPCWLDFCRSCKSWCCFAASVWMDFFFRQIVRAPPDLTENRICLGVCHSDQLNAPDCGVFCCWLCRPRAQI